MRFFLKTCFLFLFILGTAYGLGYSPEQKNPDQKLNINCFKDSAAFFLMERDKAEFFSGLSISQRLQKLYDGSFEKHFSIKFDERAELRRNLSKKQSNSDFFSGLSMQERFQKLYDGSLEKYAYKKHELRKKESYLQNSVFRIGSKNDCQKTFNGYNLNDNSVSEILQKIQQK